MYMWNGGRSPNREQSPGKQWSRRSVQNGGGKVEARLWLELGGRKLLQQGGWAGMCFEIAHHYLPKNYGWHSARSVRSLTSIQGRIQEVLKRGGT